MRLDRGRLTLPGLVILLLAFAYLGALYPVYSDLLNGTVGDLSTGEAFVYQMFLPWILLVVLLVQFRRVEGA
jgi:cytochrome c biogenesis factor